MRVHEHWPHLYPSPIWGIYFLFAYPSVADPTTIHSIISMLTRHPVRKKNWTLGGGLKAFLWPHLIEIVPVVHSSMTTEAKVFQM